VQCVLVDGTELVRPDSTLWIQVEKNAYMVGEEDYKGCATWIGLSSLKMQYHSYWFEALEYNDQVGGLLGAATYLAT